MNGSRHAALLELVPCLLCLREGPRGDDFGVRLIRFPKAPGRIGCGVLLITKTATSEAKSPSNPVKPVRLRAPGRYSLLL